MTNRVIIDVDLNDKDVKAGIRRISDMLRQMDTPSPQGWQQYALGAGAANLALGGIGLAIQGITSAANAAVSAVGSIFSESASLQTEMTSSVNTIRAVGNVSMEEAEGVFTTVRDNLNELAGDLPGVTADYLDIYKGIADNVAGIVDLQTEEGKKLFERYNTEISTLGGMLVGTSDGAIQASDANLYLNKFLQGATQSALTQLRAHEQAPALMGIIDKYYQEQGIAWEDATAEQRAQALEFARRELYPEEVLEEYRNSIDGQVQGFMDTFTNPISGIFGVAREVDGTSIAAKVEELVTKLLGEDGLFTKIGELAGKLGFTGDEYATLVIGAIDTVMGWVDSLSGWLDKVMKLIPEGGLQGLDFNLGDIYGSVYNTLADAIKSADWHEIGRSIPTTVFKMIGWGLGTVASVVTNPSFWSGLGNLLLALGTAAVQVLGGMITGAIENLGTVLGPIWEHIKTFFSGIGDWFSDKWSELQDWFSQTWENTLSFLTGIVDNVKGFFNRIPGIFQTLIDNLINIVNQVIDNMAFGLGSHLPDIPTTSPSSSAGNGSTLASGSRAIGTPDFLSNLMAERLRMPAGAVPIIANSAETILNGSQTAQLAGLLQHRVTQPSMTFAPQVTINGAQVSDPNQLANLVIQAIDRKYQEWKHNHND